MESKDFKSKKERRPEAILQDRWIKFLENRGWFIKVTHGSSYQDGFPDLFATHKDYGQRWIEIKKPNFEGSKFTPAQKRDFPKFCEHGSGVWIITTVCQQEYDKLFGQPNWFEYLSIWRTKR